MSPIPVSLDDLDRRDLLVVAHEYMLSGMIATKALIPVLTLRSGLPGEAVTQITIDEWMGASPVYTGRMRRLMQIGGDDIAAIMKALQLDVGFVHQYMDVRYQINDARHGEFWLAHCGALLDIEPFGEDQVFSMCHTIEDPTFDATALATNPRARIRPIHRPPRPSETHHPHCHWTITIDESVPPVGPIAITQQVATLPLAHVGNPVSQPDETGLRHDYSGAFDPAFRLDVLGSGTLAAVAREFQTQTHLLTASTEVSAAARLDGDATRVLIDEAWLGAAWISAERLARGLGLAPDAAGLAACLGLTPMLPPGVTRSLEVDGDRVTCSLRGETAGLIDGAHPGWPGSLARGVKAGFEGCVGGLGLDTGSITVTVDGDLVRVEAEVSPAPTDRPDPDAVALTRIGRVAQWSFQLAAPR